MNKAYIVRYVGYDLAPDNLFNDLPDEIFSNHKDAKEKFNEMIAEELQNWDMSKAIVKRSDELFYIHYENREDWTEIQLKCVTIK